MAQNRVFNIECPSDLEETVLSLDLKEFEELEKEPGFDSRDFSPLNSKNPEHYEEFLDEAFLYDIRQRIAKDLYKNGRNFPEIYKSIRQHVLGCEECSQRYVNFLGNYVMKKIKQRAEEDKDVFSLVEEVNNLPVERREKFYMDALKQADLKYLRILDVKTLTKYNPLDDATFFMFEKSKILSLPLRILRKNSLNYKRLDKMFGEN